jgi:glycosyltransferase, family 2
VTILTLVRAFIRFFNYFCMAYTLLLGVIYLAQLLVALKRVRRQGKRKISEDYMRYAQSQNLLPISLIVPARNEQENIVQNVRDLLNLEYPQFEVIVVNDGSTDDTHRRLIDAFGLYPIEAAVQVKIPTREIHGVYYNPDYPSLYYIDKENGGKSDSLNAGINLAQYPLFACLDADSRIERDALLVLGSEFLKDTTTVVAGGFVRIANGSVIENGEWKRFDLPKRMVERFQIVEYFRSFLAGRLSWGKALLIVSGAFGVFNKQVVIDAGGYKTNTIGEDMEIVVRIHRFMRSHKRPYTVKFCPEAVCWTQGPMSMRDLQSQRRRWQIGLFDTLKSHIGMTLNPRYRTVGLLSIPYSWLFEFLGTAVETLGYFIIPFSFLMGELNLYFFILYFLLAVMLGILISIGGIILEQYTRKGCMSSQQAMKLSLYAILENFGYRQAVTLFRFGGLVRYRKYKGSWGKIQRREFNAAAERKGS